MHNKHHTNLDFSAFSNKTISKNDFTKEQLLLSGIERVKGPASNIGIILMSGLAVLMVFMTGFTWSLTVLSNTVITGMSVTIVLVVTVLAAWLIMNISSNKKRLQMLRFALDNNMEYSTEKVFPPTEPIMFGIGHSKEVNNQITWKEHGVVLADYKYNTGSGKSEQTHHMSFACIKLPRKIPHLLLNAKKNLINMGHDNYHVKKLSLEGDFSKYFDLYVPPDYHIDAMQIFTPDVMAVLIDEGRDYDYEVIDDNIYIYSAAQIAGDPERNIRRMLKVAEKLAPEFSHQAKNYGDARVGGVTNDLVAAHGARLNRKKFTTGAALSVLLIIVLLLESNPTIMLHGGPLVTIGLFVLFIALLMISVIRKFRG